MGMNLARDVRSANVSAAERAEQSKYRKKADERAASAEVRAIAASDRADKELTLRQAKEVRDIEAHDMRMKSLKKGIRESRQQAKRAKKAEPLQRRKLEADVKTAEQKAGRSASPAVNAFNDLQLLNEEHYKRKAAIKSGYTKRVAPLVSALRNAESAFEKNPNNGAAFAIVNNLKGSVQQEQAKRDEELAKVEQSFVAASNFAPQGRFKIITRYNTSTQRPEYMVEGDGMTQSEAQSMVSTLNKAGGGMSSDNPLSGIPGFSPSPATQAQPQNQQPTNTDPKIDNFLK